MHDIFDLSGKSKGKSTSRNYSYSCSFQLFHRTSSFVFHESTGVLIPLNTDVFKITFDKYFLPRYSLIYYLIGLAEFRL